MAQQINKLSALRVQKIKKPGYVGDGGGLFLQVSQSGAKSWIFAFSLRGRRREAGLGPVARVSLKAARAARDACNVLIRAGTDPIEHRKRQHAAAALADGSNVTFKVAADAYIASHRAEWRNVKHAHQWENTLRDYAMPVLGSLSVRDINTGHIMRVLEPHWLTKNPTMINVKGRIKTVLDWCKVKGYRDAGSENPAVWEGALDHLLPAPAKVAKVEHHPALDYRSLPEFMQRLRQQSGTPARALEFLILTCARLNEAVGATPGEIDAANGVWTVPASRMKAGREHRVPLSRRALELASGAGAYLFPGRHPDKPIVGEMARWQLKRMGYNGITVHGMRATFKTWASEQTRVENHVVESALAHRNGDKTEASYQRGDMMEKRRLLMAEWERFCTSPPVKAGDKVVPLRKAE
jgi:integrase